MADPDESRVTSWFVPQNVLDVVSRPQAQAAADQARNTFLFGLLSGNIGAAYNNAQNQGYNALSHGMTLAESARKNQSNAGLMQAAGNSFDLVEGTGVGEVGSPGYVAPQHKFNLNRFIQNPQVPMSLATNPKALQELLGLDLINVNGMMVDKKNPSNAERFIPNLPEGAMPVGKDASGATVYGFAPGVTGMLGTKAGITASTNQRYNTPAGTVTGPNGEVVTMPGMFDFQRNSSGATASGKQPFNTTPNTVTGKDSSGSPFLMNLPGAVPALYDQNLAEQRAKNAFIPEQVWDPASQTYRNISRAEMFSGGAHGGPPFPGAPAVPGIPGAPGAPAANANPLANAPIARPGEGAIAGSQAEGALYGKQLEGYLDASKTAGSRITNARLLMNVSDRINGDKLTPVEAEVKSYLNAFGITGDATKQFLNNVGAFNAFRLEKLKDQTSTFKGSQSDKELGVLMSMGQNLGNQPDINRMYSGYEIARANQDRQISAALRTYDGPKTPQAVQAYVSAQPFMQKSLFSDPVFKEMKIGGESVQKVVEMNGKRYMTISLTKDVIPLD